MGGDVVVFSIFLKCLSCSLATLFLIVSGNCYLFASTKCVFFPPAAFFFSFSPFKEFDNNVPISVSVSISSLEYIWLFGPCVYNFNQVGEISECYFLTYLFPLGPQFTLLLHLFHKGNREPASPC